MKLQKFNVSLSIYVVFFLFDLDYFFINSSGVSYLLRGYTQ